MNRNALRALALSAAVAAAFAAQAADERVQASSTPSSQERPDPNATWQNPSGGNARSGPGAVGASAGASHTPTPPDPNATWQNPSGGNARSGPGAVGAAAGATSGTADPNARWQNPSGGNARSGPGAVGRDALRDPAEDGERPSGSGSSSR